MKVVFQVVAGISLSYFLAVPGACVTKALAMNTPSSTFGSRKPKLVKFRLRNDLRTAIDLKVGGDPVTVQPGQTININLPVGARITIATAISGHPVGEVISEVGSNLDDATVAIKP